MSKTPSPLQKASKEAWDQVDLKLEQEVAISRAAEILFHQIKKLGLVDDALRDYSYNMVLKTMGVSRLTGSYAQPKKPDVAPFSVGLALGSSKQAIVKRTLGDILLDYPLHFMNKCLGDATFAEVREAIDRLRKVARTNDGNADWMQAIVDSVPHKISTGRAKVRDHINAKQLTSIIKPFRAKIKNLRCLGA